MKRAISAAIALLVVGAASLPALAQPGRSLSDWSRVRALPPATEAIVTVAAGGIGAYRIAFADADTLVLVRPFAKRLPVTAETAIAAVGNNWPAVLGGRDLTVGTVRLTAAGIIADGVRVASVFQVPRSAVAEIRRPDRTGVPDVLLRAAAIGMLIGASPTSKSASSYDPTGYLPTDPSRAVAPALWPPALFGPAVTRSPDERLVIYRAPARTGVLTAAEIEKILKSVGPFGRTR